MPADVADQLQGNSRSSTAGGVLNIANSPRSRAEGNLGVGGLGLGLGSILEGGSWVGMKVTELIAGSPAAEVGVIKVADELLAVDGK